jgi:hypothetical protein
MVNIPYRSSESLMAERLSVRMAAHRRTAGAVVIALLAAVLIGILLQNTPQGSNALHDLVPLDDPAVSGLFTA